MKRRISDTKLFFREFLRNFHSTGAILPSGPFLAAALSRFVAYRSPGPKKILEVGPGTGAVTRKIISRMADGDSLDLVELNGSFVEQLNHRFQNDPEFKTVSSRSKVFHQPVEELPAEQTYDVIVSGLPFNNFSAGLVENILTGLTGRLAPGGTLSFFEYIAVRPTRTLVSGRAERERLRGIGKAMRAVLEPGEIRRDAIWLNVPPAWVHHVRNQTQVDSARFNAAGA
jgi:phospholipid N-methyltransferase